MSHFLGILGALALIACAGPGQNSPTTERSERSSAKVRAEKRRQRRAVRDLETEITKLKAEMTTIRRPGPLSVASPPVLPVEVLEPPSRPAPPEFAPPGEEYVVAGYDENGIEILYVGEAARTPSLRPNVDLSAGPSRPGPRPQARPRAPEVPRLTNRTATRAPERPGLTPIPSVEGGELVPAAAIGPKVSRLVTGGSRAAPRPVPVVASPPQPEPPSVSRALPKDEYRLAYAALKGSRHDEAVELFRAFLVAHRRHPYADNAQYWLGEAFYDQRQFALAKQEFLKVVTEHPSGNKVPAAKLKGAYCHLAMGEQDRAKVLLLELVAEHPNTGPAKLANEKLRSL